MSWKAATTQLINFIKDLSSWDAISDENRDELIKYTELVQKTVVSDFETLKTSFANTDVEKLKKENAELRFSLESQTNHYESHIKSLSEEKAFLNQELAKYRKRYTRSKQLVIGLTKFIEEMEDENE
jgi:hypothetical protein